MKKIFFLSIMLIFGGICMSQNVLDLKNKQFHQLDKTPNSDTYLTFLSNSKAMYIMTGSLPISGKSFRDECPCAVTVSGNKISISCICDDKEIYPDPIEDSFIYETQNQKLISNRYSIGGKYIEWVLN